MKGSAPRLAVAEPFVYGKKNRTYNDERITQIKITTNWKRNFNEISENKGERDKEGSQD